MHGLSSVQGLHRPMTNCDTASDEELGRLGGSSFITAHHIVDVVPSFWFLCLKAFKRKLSGETTRIPTVSCQRQDAQVQLQINNITHVTCQAHISTVTDSTCPCQRHAMSSIVLLLTPATLGAAPTMFVIVVILPNGIYTIEL